MNKMRTRERKTQLFSSQLKILTTETENYENVMRVGV